ncbi:hypothetical protein EVA_08603 [gut metagenome]|uniref:Uncharacterized protein n=1 Tax=gut metagenome TaxID=749906 RepID=J9CSV8_9ZZZZ
MIVISGNKGLEQPVCRLAQILGHIHSRHRSVLRIFPHVVCNLFAVQNSHCIGF